MDIEKFIKGVLRHGLTDRDLAQIEMRDRDDGDDLDFFDVEAQLLAIKSLIGRNQQADGDLERKIKDLYEQARRAKEVRNGPYQDDRWVDETYQSFFQYGAHSMAAVGMLAPFTETLFTKFFPCLPKEKDKNRQGIVKAISWLSKSKGLANFFPENYEETLDALFSYRNKMFHNGFIWPENERRKFQERINDRDRGWPTNWFVETSYQDSRDKTGNPWIFCMSTEFIEHCLWTIEQVLDGYGKWLREPLEK